tara:strand:- start:51 stop:314 length:264 start_codon:yes stop_codon:yes gene_type:complete
MSILGQKDPNSNPFIGSWHKFNTINESFENADAIVVITEWEEFNYINWTIISSFMRKPAWIFDTRNICEKEEIEKTDQNFWQVGITG